MERPPFEAAFTRRPEGFVATALTSSDAAWLAVPVAAVWTGFLIFWTSGMAVQRGWEALAGVLFLPAAAWLIAGAAMQVGGRVEVGKAGAEGWFFVGVGRVGWRWRFRWEEVREVRQLVFPARGKRGEERVIGVEMRNLRVISFGAMLDDTARGYLMAVIREGMRG